MTQKEEKNKQAALYESELRQDIVTGDFVVIATGRAKRPQEFAGIKRALADDVPDPFENPEESGQEKDVLIYRRDGGEWSLRVFPNKYPAFSRGRVARELSEGPYFAMTGVGYHEIVVTRDPVRSLALLDVWQGAEVFDAYQERYLVPVVSPYIALELRGAEEYWRSHKHKVHTVMTEYESQARKRVIFENERFIAFCPFASRVAFEIWVVGKRENPYFERITDEEKFSLAEIMQKALYAIYRGLGDPPYNFYIHTAPCDGKDYPHYQWHIEILPHTATWAGFELSTGIEISAIQPEAAAEYLCAQLSK